MTRAKLPSISERAFQVGLLLLLYLAFSSSGYSQDPGPVTVEQLLAEVLERDAESAISKRQVDQAEAKLLGARSKYLPKASASGNYFHQNTDPSAQLGGIGALFAGQNGLTVKGTLQMNVFNGFQDRHLELQRKKELEKNRSDWGATNLSEYDKASSLVFEILRNQADIENIGEKLKVEREREADLSRRVTAHSAKKADLLTVRSSILDSQEEMESAKANLASNWRSLSALTTEPLRPRTIITPHLQLKPMTSPLLAKFLPDLKASRADLDASELAVKGARGTFAPAVDVAFNHYFARPEFQRGNTWDVQLTATIPNPFDIEKHASVSEANARALQKEAVLRRNEILRQNELDSLVQNFNSDLKRQELLDQAVENQRSLVAALKNESQFGSVTLSEFLNSVSTLLQKKQKRDQLIYLQQKRFFQIRNYQQQSGEKS